MALFFVRKPVPPSFDSKWNIYSNMVYYSHLVRCIEMKLTKPANSCSARGKGRYDGFFAVKAGLKAQSVEKDTKT